MPNLFHTAFERYVDEIYPDGLNLAQRQQIQQAFQAGSFSIIMGITGATDEDAVAGLMTRAIQDMGQICALAKHQKFQPWSPPSEAHHSDRRRDKHTLELLTGALEWVRKFEGRAAHDHILFALLDGRKLEAFRKETEAFLGKKP